MGASLRSLIRNRIMMMPDGSVVGISDFCDLADSKTVSKILNRLSEEGILRTVVRGIFSKTNGETSAVKVAEAIGRSNGWKVVPCGETALYIAGIRKTEPEVWTFITDGIYRCYEADGKQIKFQHSAGRFFAHMSEESCFVVQVVKAFGKDRMDERFEKFLATFTSEKAKKIIRETAATTNWIADAVKEVFMPLLNKTEKKVD